MSDEAAYCLVMSKRELAVVWTLLRSQTDAEAEATGFKLFQSDLQNRAARLLTGADVGMDDLRARVEADSVSHKCLSASKS